MSSPLPHSVLAGRPRGVARTHITVRGLSKAFGGQPLYHGFDLDLPRGKVITFFGPNGCGKSTLINLICGLIRPDAGEVLFDGKTRSETVIGYVFQNYRDALFPWLRARDNILYPLKIASWSKGDAARRLEELVAEFGVRFDLGRYPYEFSGGRQQLISIMRAMAPRPEVVFLDEPFSALDYEATLFIRDKLQEVFRKEAVTTVIVSHDLEEAVYLADEVYLLTKRPTCIAEIVPFDVPRPRSDETLSERAFIETKRRCTPLAPLLKQPLVPEEATTKVAAVQAHATGRPGSLDAAFDMIEHAALLGVKLIVTPQHFSSPAWLPDAGEARMAANASEVVIARVAGIAACHSCTIVLPVIEATKSGFAPVAVLIGPDGRPIGRYHQVHLEPEAERWAVAGEEFRVFDTPVGRLGLMLGFDGLYPESARVLTLLGADIVVWSGAWRHRYERELLAVPKAEDNRVCVVLANRTDCPYPGGSLVIPPNGFPHWDINVAAPRATRHGAVMPSFVNLALSRQKKMIPKVDMVRNRLVATYEPLLDKAA